MDNNILMFEKGVGPIFACQICIQSFIDDITNNLNTRNYAKSIHKWLGSIECTIDELCDISYDRSVFILHCLEKYDFSSLHLEMDSNLILNYGEAIDSLRYQIKSI